MRTPKSFQPVRSGTVGVIGLGYVGWPLCLLAATKGYKVEGVDIDEQKLQKLKKSLKKTARISVGNDFSKLQKVEVVVFCVPTPVTLKQLPDFKPLQAACASFAPFLRQGQLVVLESTVNPGVTEEIMLPILEKGSGLAAGKDFFLAHCPERINPGDPKWNVSNIPRVIGGLNKESLTRGLEFYRSLLGENVKPMNSLREAEAVKIVENAFRDVNIAFVNELAMSFSTMDIDVVNVIEGAATKPFSFLAHFPGCGVGGHCIPVDPYYLIERAKENGFDHDFLSLARRLNRSMPKFTAGLVVRGLNEAKIPMRDTRIAVLGLAYKPGISDDRESPSYEIIRALEEYGSHVVSFDPFVPQKSSVDTLGEALKGAKAVVLATGHREFQDLNPSYCKRSGVAVLVDGRNFFAKEAFQEAGIIYKGIGK